MTLTPYDKLCLRLKKLDKGALTRIIVITDTRGAIVAFAVPDVEEFEVSPPSLTIDTDNNTS